MVRMQGLLRCVTLFFPQTVQGSIVGAEKVHREQLEVWSCGFPRALCGSSEMAVTSASLSSLNGCSVGQQQTMHLSVGLLLLP